jgi:hypothetical protein
VGREYPLPKEEAVTDRVLDMRCDMMRRTQQVKELIHSAKTNMCKIMMDSAMDKKKALE